MTNTLGQAHATLRSRVAAPKVRPTASCAALISLILLLATPAQSQQELATTLRGVFEDNGKRLEVNASVISGAGPDGVRLELRNAGDDAYLGLGIGPDVQLLFRLDRGERVRLLVPLRAMKWKPEEHDFVVLNLDLEWIMQSKASLWGNGR